jgi:hypothetical protein
LTCSKGPTQLPGRIQRSCSSRSAPQRHKHRCHLCQHSIQASLLKLLHIITPSHRPVLNDLRNSVGSITAVLSSSSVLQVTQTQIPSLQLGTPLTPGGEARLESPRVVYWQRDSNLGPPTGQRRIYMASLHFLNLQKKCMYWRQVMRNQNLSCVVVALISTPYLIQLITIQLRLLVVSRLSGREPRHRVINFDNNKMITKEPDTLYQVAVSWFYMFGNLSLCL